MGIFDFLDPEPKKRAPWQPKPVPQNVQNPLVQPTPVPLTPYAGPQPQPVGPPPPPTGQLSHPGTYEQTFEQAAPTLSKPMPGMSYVAGRIPSMTDAGLGQNVATAAIGKLAGQVRGNQMAREYEHFQGVRPDIATDPGLDPHYDNAQRRALEAIRAQSAAAGNYGSSAFMNAGQEAIVNLRAEQANREAQYNLDRLAEQRAWESLGGIMGEAASQQGLGWTQTLGDLGMASENMDYNKQNAAIAAARGVDEQIMEQIKVLLGGAAQSQDAFENRTGGEFDREYKLLSLLLPLIGGTYGSIFSTSDDYGDSAFSALVGEGAALENENKNRTENIVEGTEYWKDLTGGNIPQDIFGSGGGGGGGEGMGSQAASAASIFAAL